MAKENAQLVFDGPELAQREERPLVFQLFGRKIFLHRVGNRLFVLGLAKVGQRIVEIEQKRARDPLESAKSRLGFVNLLLVHTREGWSNAGIRLEALNLQRLTLGIGFGARRKIFSDSAAIEPTGHAKNDFLGRIRELGDDKRFGLGHVGFATSTGKSVA